MSNGFAASVAYTGTRSRGLRDWDWYRTEADNRARYTTRRRQPAAQPHHRLQLRDPGRQPVPGRQRHRQGRARRLAVVRRDVDEGRHAGRLQLRVHGRADGRPDAGAGRLTRRSSCATRTCHAASGRSIGSSATECVRPPGPLTDPNDTLYQGSALGDEWVNLGFINHDMTLFKNFGMRGGPQPAHPGRAVQRVQHDAVQRRGHERAVQLRDRRPDRRGLRPGHGRAEQLESRDSVRRPLHVLGRTRARRKPRGHGEELEHGAPRARFVARARGAGVGRLRAEGASASWAEALAEARPRASNARGPGEGLFRRELLGSAGAGQRVRRAS